MRKLARFFLSLLTVFALSVPAMAGDFVGNTFGTEGRYQVFEFTDNGMAVKPVSGSRYAAWPSAIRLDNTKIVFGSENVDGRWTNVRKWVSTGTGPYVDAGVVLAAGPNEPNGIGPATVTYDGGTYRLFYVIRGAQGGVHSIGLAKSTDGTNFVKSGTVFSESSPEVGAVSVSYACSDGRESFLLLHVYNRDLSAAMSLLAVARKPDGPYEKDVMILNQSGVGGSITGIAGNQFGSFTGGMRLGLPVVINGSQAAAYIPVQIKGSAVYFDRPLAENAQLTPWAEHFRNKADVSFVARTDSGWIGAVTGYGQFQNVTSEYTSPMSARDVRGPWTVESGFFLQPYFNSGRYSTENPEPIRSSASCTLD